MKTCAVFAILSIFGIWHSAILLTDSHVLVQTTGGGLILVDRSAGVYKEVRRYPVADSATWAVPALVPGGLLVRDATGLMKLVP